MRKKVAVVGDRDSVLVFKALGVDVFESIESTDARKTVDRLAKEDYGVIFITEQIAEKIKETIEPDKEIAARYEKKYQQFKKIYPALKSVFDEFD